MVSFVVYDLHVQMGLECLEHDFSGLSRWNSLDEKIDLHKFAPCEYVTNM